MNALAARRRHPAAIFFLVLLGLLVTGGAYAMVAPKPATASLAADEDVLAQGKDLFIANCASCHGNNAEGTKSGPTLIGAGAAAVDFQVGTGRMPLAGPNVQAPRNKVKFTSEQITAMSTYIASLGSGPSIPDKKYTTPITPSDQVEAGQELTNNERIARGGEIYRVNCAMCHNFAGAGGALTRGKYAPTLDGVEPRHMYEAMITGPQSMPVFNDMNISPEDKQQVISYLITIQQSAQPGGLTLGNLGPVSEGFFAWTFALGILIALAVWLGRKAA